MLLKKLRLHNIRSYTNADISFTPGALLLSGDIGSGKSTILHGIEFALFGAKPSELPAFALLRHGSKEGFVELTLSIEGKEIFIKRVLKRTNQGIKQESGYIIVNGMKKELTPVELKAEVIDLLGYPKDLIAKNKDLIYRYTVYTPQEELKRILYESNEVRLDTLRKVFNIDKYKRIRENSTIALRAIKETSKELAGFISDLESKKKELVQYENEIKSIQEKRAHLEPIVAASTKKLQETRQKTSLLEEQMWVVSKTRSEYQLCEQQLGQLLKEHAESKARSDQLEKEVSILEKEIGSIGMQDIGAITDQILQIEKELGEFQKRDLLEKKQIVEYKLLEKQSQEIISKFSKLDECPLCLQQVKHDHKQGIQETEQQKIESNNLILKRTQEKNKVTIDEIANLQKAIDSLKKQKYSMDLMALKIRHIKEKKDEKARKESRCLEIKKDIGALNAKKMGISSLLEKTKDIETQYAQAKKELESVQGEERKHIILKAQLEKETQSLEKIRTTIGQDIEKKEASKKQLVRYSSISQWLSDFFVPLMATIEKHVMVQVHREFNELFKEWFSMLIEDEMISVTIDDQFMPLIEQNGYETAIDNLSGGEKTAVALSYRLALNKVINDVISTIKTKDILMLDEPTDGFSSDQLDKVRDILNLLHMKQVILVSHETKIESFVDSIIRIEKSGHQSAVVQ